MIYDEFKRHVGRAGLTLIDLAALLSKPRATITNYSMVGVVPEHLAVIVLLMAEMAEAGRDFRPIVADISGNRRNGLGAAIIVALMAYMADAGISFNPVMTALGLPQRTAAKGRKRARAARLADGT